MRALLELMAALKGTITVALGRANARPRTLVVVASLGVAALALGTAQLVADDRDGTAPDGGLVRDVPAADGQLAPAGDGSVPGGDGAPLAAGLNEAPVAPPRSGDADAHAAAVAAGGTGSGSGGTVGAGAPNSFEVDPGSAASGGTEPSPSTAEPAGTDTTASPGTTATTAVPDPGESGGGLQALLALLGLD